MFALVVVVVVMVVMVVVIVVVAVSVAGVVVVVGSHGLEAGGCTKGEIKTIMQMTIFITLRQFEK
jgi:phosphatidylglycerophosphate synthase